MKRMMFGIRFGQVYKPLIRWESSSLKNELRATQYTIPGPPSAGEGLPRLGLFDETSPSSNLFHGPSPCKMEDFTANRTSSRQDLESPSMLRIRSVIPIGDVFRSDRSSF